jgi:hypothetical protein
MKGKGFIIVLITFGFVLNSGANLVRLLNNKRYVVIETQSDARVLKINSFQYLVPYTIQKTSIPVSVNGLTQVLFLGGTISADECLFTTFNQLILLIMIMITLILLHLKSSEINSLPLISRVILIIFITFCLSEILSYYVNRSWVEDIENLSGYHYPNYPNSLYPKVIPLTLLFIWFWNFLSARLRRDN